jgi:drug/metabolite transporter (DMT)-like permease
MQASKTTSLAYGGVLLAVFFWGTNFNAGAYIIHHMAPISAALERFVVATTLILLLFGLRGELRLATLKNNFWVFALLGLLSVTTFNLAMFVGLRSTTAINGALIMATTPLSTMLLAALLENETLTLQRGAGLAVGLAGVVAVITRGHLQALLDMKIATGDLIIFGGSVAWSLNTVLSRKLLKGANAQETASFTMLFGTLGLAVLAGTMEQPLEASIAAPLGVHAALLYTALGGSLLAYLSWFNGVQKLGSSRTAVFFNLVPVFTMLVSAMLGSLPNGWQLLGALTVIAGVALTSGINLRPAPAPRLAKCG